jgi:hypothetical protein
LVGLQPDIIMTVGGFAVTAAVQRECCNRRFSIFMPMGIISPNCRETVAELQRFLIFITTGNNHHCPLSSASAVITSNWLGVPAAACATA